MSKNIIGYLLGECDYDGFWFNDIEYNRKGIFWWRTLLRKYIEAKDQRIAELQAENDVLLARDKQLSDRINELEQENERLRGGIKKLEQWMKEHRPHITGIGAVQAILKEIQSKQ